MCLILVHPYVPLTCIEMLNLSMSLHFRKACNDPRIGTLWKAKKTVRELQTRHATCSTSHQRKNHSSEPFGAKGKDSFSSRNWRKWNELRSSLLKTYITHIYFTDLSRFGALCRDEDAHVHLFKKVFVEARQDKSSIHHSCFETYWVFPLNRINIYWLPPKNSKSRASLRCKAQKNLLIEVCVPVNLNMCIIYHAHKTSPK